MASCFRGLPHAVLEFDVHLAALLCCPAVSNNTANLILTKAASGWVSASRVVCPSVGESSQFP